MITSKRGLRQCDSLSPLLFVLAVDAFTKMLVLADNNGLLTKLSAFNFTGRLSLQYADDTLVFVNTNLATIRALKILLYVFELASGLKINSNKSFIY